jgi:hypothetical protein
LEERLEWLSREFQQSAFAGGPIVLPTPDFFPDRYDGSQDAARALAERVCDYMDVSPSLIDLRFHSTPRKLWLVNEAGKYLPHAAGTYEEGDERFVIRLDSDGLHDAMALVGTVAHELAHVRLLGEGRLSRDAFDNELLTDLTVVFLGLGIFLANTPRVWESQFSTWPDCDLVKPEYMTPPMFGHALAHLAWFRGERKPAWARHLNSSARANLKQGLRYLWETQDSAFYPPENPSTP